MWRTTVILAVVATTTIANIHDHLPGAELHGADLHGVRGVRWAAGLNLFAPRLQVEDGSRAGDEKALRDIIRNLSDGRPVHHPEAVWGKRPGISNLQAAQGDYVSDVVWNGVDGDRAEADATLTKPDITLVTTMVPAFYGNLQIMLSRWQGPVVVAVFINDPAAATLARVALHCLITGSTSDDTILRKGAGGDVTRLTVINVYPSKAVRDELVQEASPPKNPQERREIIAQRRRRQKDYLDNPSLVGMVQDEVSQMTRSEFDDSMDIPNPILVARDRLELLSADAEVSHEDLCIEILGAVTMWGDVQHNLTAAAQNRLRNLAGEFVSTTHVLYTVPTLVPSQHVYSEAIEALGDDGDTVLVVPAFEYRTKDVFHLNCGLDATALPQVKSALLAEWEAGRARPYEYEIWPDRATPTDYKQWKTTKGGYRIVVDIDEVFAWEPFYVTKTSNGSKRYNEAFVGIAYDRRSHVVELIRGKAQFQALVTAFMVNIGFHRSRNYGPLVQDFLDSRSPWIDFLHSPVNRH